MGDESDKTLFVRKGEFGLSVGLALALVNSMRTFKRISQKFSSVHLSFHLSWLSPLMVALAIAIGYAEMNGAFQRDLAPGSGMRALAGDGDKNEQSKQADDAAKAAADSKAMQEKRTEYDQYLRTMGFDDHAAEMKKSLANHNFLDPNISPKVLAHKIQQYEMYNGARRVALELMMSLHDTNRSPESRQKVIELAGKLYTTKPRPPAKEFPPEIMNIADVEQREAKAWEYMVVKMQNDIQTTHELLLSDTIAALYGESVRHEVVKQIAEGKITAESNPEFARLIQISQSLGGLVKMMYTDHEMGSFAVGAAGKALVLGLEKFAIDSERDPQKREGLGVEMKTMVRDTLAKYGVHYENIVGDTLVVKNVDGDLVKIHVENADDILERSLGKQAHEITGAMRPYGFKNLIYHAARFRILGSFIMAATHYDEETKATTWLEKARRWIYDRYVLQRGLSHVGLVEVRVDPKTGIKTVWVLDSYPDAEQGGVRFIDPLMQFAKQGEYMRIAITRRDAKKIQAHHRAVLEKGGFKRDFWNADREAKFDGTLSSEGTENWDVGMSEEESRALAAIEDPAEYKRQVDARTIRAVYEKFLYKGSGFAYGFRNVMGRVYCATLAAFARWMGSGVDPQVKPDRWNSLLLLAKKMGVPSAQKLRDHIRTVAPSYGFDVALMDMKATTIVTFENMTEVERAEQAFASFERFDTDPVLRDLLERVRAFAEATEFTGKKNELYYSTLVSELTEVLEAADAREGKMGKDRGQGTYSDARGYAATALKAYYDQVVLNNLTRDQELQLGFDEAVSQLQGERAEIVRERNDARKRIEKARKRRARAAAKSCAALFAELSL